MLCESYSEQVNARGETEDEDMSCYKEPMVKCDIPGCENVRKNDDDFAEGWGHISGDPELDDGDTDICPNRLGKPIHMVLRSNVKAAEKCGVASIGTAGFIH